MKDDAFLEKLRKMRDMSMDKSLTEEEAALWAEKLAKLLADRGLELSHLGEGERDDHMIESMQQMMYTDPWRVSIMQSLAHLYFCYIFFDYWKDTKGEWRKGLMVVGRPCNVETVKHTYEYLERTTLRLAADYVRSSDVENDIRLGATTTRAARLGFERGCGTRLASRIWRMYQESSQSESKEIPKGNTLPALYKSELELAKEFANRDRNLKAGRGRGSSINDHGQAGRRAADSVSLNSQLSGGSTSRGLLK